MDLIKQLRRNKEWSQEHLAQAANISRPTVQRIESGRHVPSKETLLALASALDVDVAALRNAIGLAGLISQTMAIVVKRDANSKELARLPQQYRVTFASFQAARQEMVAAQDHQQGAFESWLHLHEQRSAAFDERLGCLVEAAAQPREATRRALRIAAARVDELSAALAAAYLDVGRASERCLAAMSTFGDTGLAMTKMLVRFV